METSAALWMGLLYYPSMLGFLHILAPETPPKPRYPGMPHERSAATLPSPPRRLLPIAVVALATLLGSTYFLIAERGVAGRWGFSLDDSWIYATFARNLATGHGYSFNPGEAVGGATGPLYVFILAGLYSLFHEVIWPVKILGFLCLAGSSLLVYHSVQHIGPRDRVKPLLAGLLTALSPSLLWGSASGMEIPVYFLAVCLGLHAYVRQKWTLAVMWWSLGVWLRPDGLFLALVGLVARPKPSLKNSIAPLVVAASIIGGFLLFNDEVGGPLLPKP